MNTNKQTVRHYWRQIRKHKKSFFIALIGVPAASLLLDTIFPLYLSKAVGALQQGDVGQLQHVLIIAGIVSFAGVVLNIISFQALVIHEAKVRANLIDATMTKLIYMDQAFFARQKIGALTGKFIDFINAHVALQDLLIMRTLTFAINIIIGVAIISTASPAISLLVVGLVAALIVQIRLSIKLRGPLRKERKRLISEGNGAVADTISNSLTVKTFAHEEHELREIHTISEQYRRAHNKDFRWMSIEGSLRLLLMSIIQIATVGIVAYLYINGQVQLEMAVFVIIYLQRIAAQLFSLGDIINGYDRYFLQAAPMSEILQEEDRIRDAPNAKELQVKSGAIKFSKVCYSYEDDKSANVIDELSITITPGQKVGLIGRSGAGKTTLTKALLRFDDISSGEITIDDQNIQNVTQESLRKAISYVPQEPLLFHRSLRENIAYGNLQATDEQILKATKLAHAWEFVKRLPDGFDTIVGERGVKLSGGQRQRIAIARAILKDAPILILDEATAALDSESEKLIQDALDTLMIGRTAIAVAHRLSTIAKLDRIIVLDAGRIIEDGTHAELLAMNGVYAKLWSHQSGGFLEE